HLTAGDILVFEEVIGPRTGVESDADPTHRHAVLLTKVTASEDRLYDPPLPVLEIEWAREDALPFPLCISSLGLPPECRLIENVSVVRGNVILVDHGRTVIDSLGNVGLMQSVQVCEEEEHASDVTILAAPFSPTLKQYP